MPLNPSSSVSDNIRELHSGETYEHTKDKFGKKRANSQAIAIALSVARKAKRASGGKVHLGPIKGEEPGRTDVHEMNVPDGAYVFPADFISHLGENNTDAGMEKANQLFGERGKHSPRKYGGRTEKAKPVPCITAGGEFVVSPETVRHIGGGDLDTGHKILDHFVMLMRKDHIKTLAKLPRPAKD